MGSRSEIESLVSIGMPIYQSVSKFGSDEIFRNCIESLLTQTYTNIELIIVDNASTDATWEICQEYAQKDLRIRLIRNPQNMGVVHSMDLAYRSATGKYYMIAADDDYWDSDFIHLCLEPLENDPSIDLCYPVVCEHNLIKKTEYARNHLVDDTIDVNWKRATHLLDFKLRPHTIIQGIFRREKIAHLMPLKMATNPDLIFLIEFASRSKFIGIHQTLIHKYVRPKKVQTEFSAKQYTLPTPKNIRLAVNMIYYFLEIAWKSDASLLNKVRWTLIILKYCISGFIYVLTLHRIRL